MSTVAIIGNGIAGASVARRLALAKPDAFSRISLHEMGRGPGGRAATRKTRSLPELRINHGAPYADISTGKGLDLLASLGDATETYSAPRCTIDGKTGAVEPVEQDTAKAMITGRDGEMANIAGDLLRDGNDQLLSPIVTHYSSMVRGLSRGPRPGDPWRLSDKNGDEIDRADWLIAAGSGIAHPRWSATFGGEPPLVAAASEREDPALNDALARVARQTAAPVLTVLLYCTDDLANEWQSLAFRDGTLTDHTVLSKISIQPCGQAGCAVVLHSTVDYAVGNAGVHGSSSSAARVGDASSDTTREAAIIDEMLAALDDIPGLPAAGKSRYAFGPLLHRWGNAFPQGEALPQALSVCPESRVAFCGDYVATDARMGSCESALLSGVEVADTIIDPIEARSG